MNHGSKTRVHVNGVPLSKYIENCDVSIAIDAENATVMESSAKEYIAGLPDSSISASGFYDGDSEEILTLLDETLSTGGDIWTWFPNGDVLGEYGRAMTAHKSAHSVQNTIDGGCRISIAGKGTGPSYRVASIIPRSIKTSSGSGSSLDNTSSTSGGAVGVLQVVDITGSIVVKIEDSANNSDWSDLITFVASTAQSAQMVAVAGTVERYVRATYTLDGGESIELQVSIKRL